MTSNVGQRWPTMTLLWLAKVDVWSTLFHCRMRNLRNCFKSKIWGNRTKEWFDNSEKCRSQKRTKSKGTKSLEKNWGARRIKREFLAKNWPLSSIDFLLRKIDETGEIDRREGQGRPRTVRNDENAEIVGDLISSQEGQPGADFFAQRQRQISNADFFKFIVLFKRNFANFLFLKLLEWKKLALALLCLVEKLRRPLESRVRLFSA